MKNCLKLLNRIRSEGRISYSDYSELFDAICGMEPQWTSVDEDMPSFPPNAPIEEHKYIVLLVDGSVVDALYSVADGEFGYYVPEYIPSNTGEGFMLSEHWFGLKEATHWMPMPVLPEEAK